MKPQTVRPLNLAIAALGGQGGGVLAQWVVDMAEANGYLAQSTSVPGVAQRTGATIYYLELFPRAEAEKAGRDPVLALMPVPGDVDVCMASELVEAGRAMGRGFVSPGRTTLIASSHRIYAIAEKETPGDGRIDEAEVRAAAKKAAKKLVMFDMDKASADTGSVISAVLFGALAGSGALPFPRQAYEDIIRHTGIAVEANLAGFAQGFEEAQGRHVVKEKPAAPTSTPMIRVAGLSADLAQAVDAFPEATREVITEGVRRLADYQDKAYARLYLDRLKAVAALDHDADHRLLTETARYLALWMGFEDVIRVADLKTRAGRFEKIRDEVRAKPGQYFNVVEFFHPRYDEFCDTLPAWLGGPLASSGMFKKMLAPLFAKGRNLSTGTLSGFLPLYFLAGMRRWRRSTLRFKRENALIEAWLAEVVTVAPANPALAVELAQCPRLIKGYGDTHERGYARFARVLETARRLAARDDAALKIRALRDAALEAESPEPFEAALAQAV